MAGFFEFSMMRTRGDIDQKALGELFYQYLNVEEDFIKALFIDGETQLGRVFVQEPMLTRENAVHVLDYERASEVIRTASHRAIRNCYCRHKMQHMGRDCDAPKDICMTFNTSAASLSRHGHARPVDTAECLDLLDLAQEHGLRKVSVFVKGPGSGRETAIRTLQAAGLEIASIQDRTPVPHNGCRQRKRRRV